MRDEKTIGRPMRLMGLIGFMGLVGCTSSEEVGPVEPEKSLMTVELMPYMTAYEDEEPAKTRAWNPPTVPTAFALVAGTENNTIGICFTRDGQEPEYGHFFVSSGKWRTNVEISSAATYYLYGYTPHTTGVSCTVAPGAEGLYSNGAVLTINNLPAISPDDVCVLVGAKNGKDDYDDNPLVDYSVTGLQQGQFAYAAEPTGPGTGNYAFLLFDHLFSALRLRFNVNSKYASLRTIKVKELSLKTYTDPSNSSTVNSKTYNVSITLTKTLDGSSPIVNGLGEDMITFTPSGGEADEEGTTFYTSEAGEELPTEPAYETFMAHFVPAGVGKLILKSKYDVYDKKGNLVRKNCIAENAIMLNDLFSGQMQTIRGRRYTINLTVNPTYIYIMSDPDLDNPTFEVN